MSESNPTPGAPAAPAVSEPALAMPPTSVVMPAGSPAAAPAATPAPAAASETVIPAAEPAAAPGEPSAAPPGEPASEPGKEAAPEAKPTEPAAPEEPAAPAYADLKMPEGFEARPEVMAEVTKLFGEMKVAPADAQKLVDLHGTILKNAVQGYSQAASEFWNKKAQDWVKEVKADPDIGGNRFDTSIKRARGVWNAVIPNEADRTRLFNDLTDTKIGDHPVLAKALSEVGRRFEQVFAATGTTNWADAMKKLREPGAPPPGTPARAPSSNRAADRRYSGNR